MSEVFYQYKAPVLLVYDGGEKPEWRESEIKKNTGVKR